MRGVIKKPQSWIYYTKKFNNNSKSSVFGAENISVLPAAVSHGLPSGLRLF